MTKNTTRNLKKRVVSVPSTFALFFQKYKHKIIVEKVRPTIPKAILNIINTHPFMAIELLPYYIYILL